MSLYLCMIVDRLYVYICRYYGTVTTRVKWLQHLTKMSPKKIKNPNEMQHNADVAASGSGHGMNGILYDVVKVVSSIPSHQSDVISSKNHFGGNQRFTVFCLSRDHLLMYNMYMHKSHASTTRL
jgi:hypothetical protein